MEPLLNKIHCMDNLEGMKLLPDKSAILIISDPPYFNIKGDFDFVYNSRDEWLVFMRKQAEEYKRVLSDNGTLFVWGHALNIAYIQVLFDEFFVLENSLVWEKKDGQQRRSNFTSMRRFAPVTERVLMYSSDSQIKVDWQNRNISTYLPEYDDVRLYIKAEIEKIGIKEVAAHLGICDRAVGHWIYKAQWYMPSDENVKKMQKLGIFKDYDWSYWQEVKRLYNSVKTENSRYFDNSDRKLTDVLRFIQETHISRMFDHETQKPEQLTRALILTTTRPNDLVLIPFAGSGTECAMCAKENRYFVGFDIEQKYVNMANSRCEQFLQRVAMAI